MTADPLFMPLGSSAATIELTFNGRPLRVPATATVASTLMAAGVWRFRTSPVSGAGRAPYCMMGVCFECLLDIDGIPNRQACLVPPREGMAIRTQDNLPEQPVASDEAALALAHAAGGRHGG